MFYNALLRKGKGSGVKEELMTSVIAIHNNMNERAWKQAHLQVRVKEKITCSKTSHGALVAPSLRTVVQFKRSFSSDSSLLLQRR